MKFTKITDTFKSKLLLLSPALLLLVSLLLRTADWENLFFRIASYACFLYVCFYFWKNGSAVLNSFGIVNEIYVWQNDRKCFDIAFEDIESAERIISKRIDGYGKVCDKTQGKILPVKMARKCTFRRSLSEKDFCENFVLLYKTEHLDEKMYEQILNASKVAVRQNHAFNPFWFMVYDKKELKDKKRLTGKNSSVAATVIIICDSSSGNFADAVRRGNGKNEEYQILPCVCDISARKCYFDARADMGLFKTKKTAHNRSVKMAKKFIFGGSLPYKDNENLTEKTFDEKYENMSVYELLKEMGKEEYHSKK